ncbi:MAG: FAD-dependent oxidoreductase [Bacteroidales bacterium]|nr:FAD-dependent oxidoreductase [Bacteroidales bacterium]
MVKKYQAQVINHINLADNIYSLEFASLSKAFKYSPGQFLHLAIDYYDGIGQWPDSRCFSMQSNPGEASLKITYAAKGIYTNRMAQQLKLGDQVWLKMPYGTLFENNHNKDKSVFIAGGTGITPFLSLFTDVSFSEYKCPFLFFGVREVKYNLYQPEIDKALQHNPGMSLKIYIEDINGRPAVNEIINAHGTSANFFISGPPAMIAFYKQSLISAKVNEGNILTDDWE